MKLLVVLAGGIIFGLGLGISGLVRQEVVLSFLHLEDLGLALVMGAAVGVTLPVYQLAPRLLGRPLLGGSFPQFPSRVLPPHILGGVLFGLGWGIAGVCPGAALASLGMGNWPMLYGFAGMLVGAYLQVIVAERMPALHTGGERTGA
ncbi:MAG: YeeE/YedE family protein [Planctomycetota bacterium]